MSENPNQLSEQGKIAFRDEDYPQAINYFKTAQASFATADQPLMAAETANNLSVAYLKNGDAAAALQAVEGTDTVFAQAGDTRRQAMALANQAAALEGLKNWNAALELYQKSSALLKDAGEKELRAYVLKSISAIQLRQGKQLEAVASMDASLDNKPNRGLLDRLLQRLIQWVYRLLGR